MKVLILCNHLNVGGITTYVLDVASALRERGFEVWIGSSGGSREGEVPDHLLLDVRGKNAFSPGNLALIPRLIRCSRELGIDLLWAHTRITQVLAHFTSGSLGLPYITTFHGFFTPKLGRRILPAYGKTAIAVSRSVAKHMVTDLGIPQERVKVIYNALPEGRVRLLESKRRLFRETARRNFGLENALVLGMMCRLHPAKGLALAVRILEHLPENFRLLILADGPKERREWFRTLLADSPAKNRVIWLRELEDVGLFWASVDLFLMLSDREGFGYSLLEAFSCGIPVVTTNCGGPAELVRHGREGLILDSDQPERIAEELEGFWKRPGALESAGRQARERLASFDFNTFVREVESVILSSSKA